MVQYAVEGEATRSVETLAYFDKLAVIVEVLLPTLAKGTVLRRPTMMALTAWLDMDARAVRRLQKIRDKYGNGPLRLSIFGRKHALILSKDDLGRVLSDAPAPFTPASDEKSATLRHFEPHVSLLSHGEDRVKRRRLNDEALESTCPNHTFAARFEKIAEEEANALLAYAGPTLTWEEFSPAWDRIVRRIVLGDAARDDTRLTDLLKELRGAGNWASLRGRKKRVFSAYMERLERHLSRAEPGSLAAALANAPKSDASAPLNQATHWIFAFDAGAIATFSTLALLSTHPEQKERALREAAALGQRPADPARPSHPFLRACLLEALRLWPTTMIVHRKSTEETTWENGVLPAEISVLLFAPYFHRDDRTLPHANGFAPDIWKDDPGRPRLPLIPFSAGPGVCPGRHVVLLAGSATLAALLKDRDIAHAEGQPLGPHADLPGTLNHFALEIGFSPRPATPPAGDAVTAP